MLIWYARNTVAPPPRSATNAHTKPHFAHANAQAKWHLAHTKMGLAHTNAKPNHVCTWRPRGWHWSLSGGRLTAYCLGAIAAGVLWLPTQFLLCDGIGFTFNPVYPVCAGFLTITALPLVHSASSSGRSLMPGSGEPGSATFASSYPRGNMYTDQGREGGFDRLGIRETIIHAARFAGSGL